jgi:hypothetical protein
MAIYTRNIIKDKWIIVRDINGIAKDIKCNGHSILVNKLNIEYPIEKLPILHLDIILTDFDFENIEINNSEGE